MWRENWIIFLPKPIFYKKKEKKRKPYGSAWTANNVLSSWKSEVNWLENFIESVKKKDKILITDDLYRF